MLNQRLNRLIKLFKGNLKFSLSITLGIFLFILFFQPFSLDRFDFNNRLLFVAGFVGIIFLLMILVQTTLQTLIRDKYSKKDDVLLYSYAGSFLILVLSSVAITFYLRYVGWVDITFFVVFKVVLICLIAPVIHNIYENFQDLKYQNESLISEKQNIMKEIERYEEDYLNQSIEFISEYNADHLNLQVADILMIRSADNYVEIVYREGLLTKKKLIRNTMKNIEQQLKPFSNFVRCHRMSIINSFHIEKLNQKFNVYLLKIKNFEEPIPVSRQYLLRIKELV